MHGKRNRNRKEGVARYRFVDRANIRDVYRSIVVSSAVEVCQGDCSRVLTLLGACRVVNGMEIRSSREIEWHASKRFSPAFSFFSPDGVERLGHWLRGASRCTLVPGGGQYTRVAARREPYCSSARRPTWNGLLYSNGDWPICLLLSPLRHASANDSGIKSLVYGGRLLLIKIWLRESRGTAIRPCPAAGLIPWLTRFLRDYSQPWNFKSRVAFIV